MDTFAIIPAYNEEKNIAKVIREVKKYTNNIIVIDDGSKDSTYKEAIKLSKNKDFVLRHIINLGKGAALKTGSDYAINKGADVLIYLDSDGQHNPKNIPKFLEKLKNNDIVFGSRKLDKNMPFILKVGNWTITKTTKLLYNIELKDTLSGYRALTKKAYGKIRWKSSDYSVESEMIANAGKHKLKYDEIGIETIYSDKYKGTTVLDGIKIVLNMLWWKLGG